MDHVTIKDGFYLEFGVCTGGTINFIGSLNSEREVYGFDSFEGLPEQWNFAYPKGTFSLKSEYKDENFVPLQIMGNVTLYKGWFSDTLPLFKQEVMDKAKEKRCAFIHIDCDLYSSTKCIFDTIGKYIVSGTVIEFDELYGYPGWREHEYKALTEFCQERGMKYEYLCFNELSVQCAIRFI
jgi:Macrocin-O-methyltransferase (TylF)